MFNSHQFYMDKYFLKSENTAPLPDFSHLCFIVGLLWASVTAVLNPFVQLSLPSNKASSTYITSIPIALGCPIIVLTQYSTRLSLAFSLPPDHSIILITYFHTFHLPSTPRLSLNLNLPCLVCSLIIVITIIILSLHWLTHLYISKSWCVFPFK